jgi:5-methylthioadenosine/S-adenosylhomocysteine deaminase
MPPKQPVDLLIEARWVLPIAPVNAALKDHALAITDGRIVAIGPARELEAQFEAGEHVVRSDHALLPGFVNAHTHAATVLLRGLPVRSPLSRFLRETVWPTERRHMSEDFVRDGTKLAIAEMLRAGITAFADMYLYPEEAARAAASARMRAVIGLPVFEGPTPWAENVTGYLAKGERLWDEYKSDPWVCLYFAPHAAAAMGDSTLTHLRALADELEARVAVSLHETQMEIRESLANAGLRPLQRMEDLGLLRPGFAAIHMNHLEPEDLDLVARTGISVVACPQSSLRLGSGFCPVGELQARGISLGLGSGSAITAGALDILAEARAAALSAGIVKNDAHAMSAEAILGMATLGGASTLGLGSQIGSLESGKAADVIAIDLSELANQPSDATAESVLFAATRQQVSDVWIGGRAAVANGRLLSFDAEELLALSRQWQERLRTGGER